MENKNEVMMFFKTSGGVTLLSTPTEFERKWKDYILSRGETYTAVPAKETDTALMLVTFDQILEDRDGKSFSVWHTYVDGRVWKVTWTIGGLTSSVTEQEFPVAA